MIVVGLTGGIATGKSTVAAMFAAQGAAAVDADRLGHALQEPGAACHAPLVAAFGPEAMDAAGRIDRRRLGALVFADPEARRRLDEIMRPAIWDAVAAAVRAAAAAGFGVCVVEAAILLEAGWRDRVQAVVVVTAPEAVQVERLVRERGLSEAEARQRMAALWPNSDKVAQADFVVENGGDLAATEAQVEQVLAALRRAEVGPAHPA